MYYFLIALTLILITLKLMGTITLTWWVIVPLALLICALPLMALLVIFYVAFFA